MGIVIEIEGVDKTSLVQQKQLSITDELNSRNTYGFDIIDPTGAYRPAVGQEAIVYSEEHYNDARDIGDGTFTRASVATKLDGTEVASGVERYETGQFSQSIMVEEGTSNLLTANQSSVETDTTGFIQEGAGNTLTRDTTTSWQGIASIKIISAAGIGYGARATVTSASASTTYTASAYIKGSVGGERVRILLFDVTNNYTLANITLTTFWQRIKTTLTTGVLPVTDFRIRIETQYSEVLTWYADGLQLEQKAYATSWTLGGSTRSPESLTIPTAGVLSSAAGTIEGYVNLNRAPGTIEQYLFDGGGAINNNLQIYVGTDGKLRAAYGTGAATVTITGTHVLTMGVWYAIAVKWSASGVTLYLNGAVEASSGTAPGFTFGANAYIGSKNDSTSQLDGQIDDLRISSIARSDADILAGYNSGIALIIDQYTMAKMAFDGALEIFARPILYAGTIDSLGEYSPNSNRTGALAYNLNCVDYNQLCGRFLVAETYNSYLAGDIVKHIIDDFINVTSPGEGVTYANVQDGPTISKAVFNYIYATQAFDELAEIAGFSWWISYDKDMHFCSRLTNAAPFGLTDTSNNFRNPVIHRTRQDYRNKQYFRGGKDTSSSQTESFVGDGTNRTFVLSLPCAKVPTSVMVNATPPSKSIGIYQVDTGKDFYWQEDSFNITQDSGGVVLTVADILAVTYQGYFPIIYENFLESAISERQSVEGGTGIYESAVTDESINTSAAVAERTEALLRKYGVIPETVEFETDTDGLKAGQLISIVITKHNLNASYLIQRVTISDITANILRYQVTALSGENIGGWVDFFKKLAKAGQGYTIRENEVLLKVRNFSDNLRLTDTLTVTSGSPIAIVDISLVGYSETG